MNGVIRALKFRLLDKEGFSSEGRCECQYIPKAQKRKKESPYDSWAQTQQRERSKSGGSRITRICHHQQLEPRCSRRHRDGHVSKSQHLLCVLQPYACLAAKQPCTLWQRLLEDPEWIDMLLHDKEMLVERNDWWLAAAWVNPTFLGRKLNPCWHPTLILANVWVLEHLESLRSCFWLWIRRAQNHKQM